MSGEKNLDTILKNLNPVLNEGRYVYTSVKNIENIPLPKILFLFRESDEITLVLRKEDADELNLGYSYVAAWITFKIHSSLEAVGMTAAFSKVLGEANISCNVVAAFYHDHVFVDEKDAERAINILKNIQ